MKAAAFAQRNVNWQIERSGDPRFQAADVKIDEPRNYQ